MEKDREKKSEVSAKAVSSPTLSAESLKSDALLRRGQELFAVGMFSQAIHVWTRILFLERGHVEARQAIERGKKAVAEQHRLLDMELAAASELLERGDSEQAAAKVKSVLALDPRNHEGHQLAARIHAAARRIEAGRRSGTTLGVAAAAAVPAHEPTPATKRGLLLRVPHSSPRRDTRMAHASPLKMASFVLAAILVFASGAFYLHLNWDSIVSDGAFRAGGALSRTVSERAAVPLPATSELYYFNGARLFAKGRYRDALDELSLVERDSVVAERARGLILRIEERLLRDVSELGTNEPNK
ncbi:MAG: hypothetical protein E2P02_01175 [Acidobacteria bacterium]|nr:MAG: hypothetical protein E2P02_01175 [Acidobacteriota bacterium]